jgi:uncharacterized protein YktB (UPF0637 family)
MKYVIERTMYGTTEVDVDVDIVLDEKIIKDIVEKYNLSLQKDNLPLQKYIVDNYNLCIDDVDVDIDYSANNIDEDIIEEIIETERVKMNVFSNAREILSKESKIHEIMITCSDYDKELILLLAERIKHEKN